MLYVATAIIGALAVSCTAASVCASNGGMGVYTLQLGLVQQPRFKNIGRYTRPLSLYSNVAITRVNSST